MRRIRFAGIIKRCFALTFALLFPATALPAAALEATNAHARPAEQSSSSGPIFVDISEASGLDFVHFNGMSGEYYFPEMMGQGCAFLDYDNDGDLDVYLVQGSMLGPGKTLADALFPPRDSNPRHRLYRNDLTIGSEGSRTVRFVDVTDQSQINISDYGMGVATGDFNNDGWVDIFVTNLESTRMLYNNGDGTFTDVTEKSGTSGRLWATSASAFDYDRDGWLDLYVANYLDFDLVRNRKCYAPNSRRDYCGPSSFTPQSHRLFHNKGDGTFEDVTTKVLADYKAYAGLGAVAIDADGDGWPDIYVANDGYPNQLWLNREGKMFREDALFAGVALDRDGRPQGSMGIAVGDFDADGDEDLFVTNIMGETNTLYANDGQGLFEDRTIATGLAAATVPYTSFGTGWIDYDNDGWLDLFMVNGAVLIIEELARAGDPYPLRQPKQLLRNENGKRFVDITADAGKDLLGPEVSRGLAFGDVDSDGDTDLLVANNNGHVRLYENKVGQQKKWLGLRLVDSQGKRDMIGALAGLKRAGMPTLWRRVRTDGSYCSANDPRLLFGLGDSETVDSIEIYWPDGTKEVWEKPVPMKYTTLKKGSVNKETGQ